MQIDEKEIEVIDEIIPLMSGFKMKWQGVQKLIKTIGEANRALQHLQ
jgi:hypothetical protein